MQTYLFKRLLYALLMLVLVSIASFTIIQLPPGDFVDNLAANLASEGQLLDKETIASFRAQYGLDKPIYVQYLIWVSGVLQGDFGFSFYHEKPVTDLIFEVLGMTLVISFFAITFTYMTAIPIGIISAVHQHSVLDYVFTLIGFIGLAIPDFLLALILMYVGFEFFDLSVGGLFSKEYLTADWSWGKFVDMMKHIWIPVIIIGTAGTAGIIRVMRGCLLDELGKQYVQTARAKGLQEAMLILKYPVRLAINPIISTIGWILPQIVSGTLVVSIVMALPTTGSLLLNSLRSQDMYLAGSLIMLLSVLTVLGTLVSDILLAVADPRIRLDK